MFVICSRNAQPHRQTKTKLISNIVTVRNSRIVPCDTPMAQHLIVPSGISHNWEVVLFQTPHNPLSCKGVKVVQPRSAISSSLFFHSLSLSFSLLSDTFRVPTKLHIGLPMKKKFRVVYWAVRKFGHRPNLAQDRPLA